MRDLRVWDCLEVPFLIIFCRGWLWVVFVRPKHGKMVESVFNREGPTDMRGNVSYMYSRLEYGTELQVRRDRQEGGG